mgnify:CR=1 FL=1
MKMKKIHFGGSQKVSKKILLAPDENNQLLVMPIRKFDNS